MTTAVRELVDFLSVQFPAETIRGAFIPDGETVPDRLIAVLTTAGEDPPAETFVGMGKGPKLNMELPNFSIRCRTPPDTAEDSLELAEDVYQFIHNQSGLTLGTTFYSLIEAAQPPFLIGTDEQGRWLSGFDIRCWKVKST